MQIYKKYLTYKNFKEKIETPEILKNVLNTSIEGKLSNGIITTDEIGLNITKSNMVLPCGVYGRWESK